jgi:hypothetical protein
MATGEICTGIYIYMDASGRFAYRFEPSLKTARIPAEEPRSPVPLDWSKPKRFVAQEDGQKDEDFGEDPFRRAGEGRPRRNIRKSSKKSRRLLDLFRR